MTAVLTVWIVMLTLATAGNLLLCFAVIRRLKSSGHTPHADPMAGVVGSPRVGDEVGDFETVALNGAPLRLEECAHGRQQAVFLTPTCRACLRLLQALQALEPSRTETPRSFFLIADDPAEEATRTMAAQLARLGRVSVVGLDSSALAAFGGVAIFPTVVDLMDGRIAWVGQRLPADPALVGR